MQSNAFTRNSTLHRLSWQFCSNCADQDIPYCYGARRCFVVFVVTLSWSRLFLVVPSLTYVFNFFFTLAYISLRFCTHAVFRTNFCVYFLFLPWWLSFPFQDLRKYSNIYPTRCNVTQFILCGNCSTCFGWYHHPKYVEQFPDKINCVTLHLVGYILEYWIR